MNKGIPPVRMSDEYVFLYSNPDEYNQFFSGIYAGIYAGKKTGIHVKLHWDVGLLLFPVRNET